MDAWRFISTDLAGDDFYLSCREEEKQRRWNISCKTRFSRWLNSAAINTHQGDRRSRELSRRRTELPEADGGSSWITPSTERRSTKINSTLSFMILIYSLAYTRGPRARFKTRTMFTWALNRWNIWRNGYCIMGGGGGVRRVRLSGVSSFRRLLRMKPENTPSVYLYSQQFVTGVTARLGAAIFSEGGKLCKCAAKLTQQTHTGVISQHTHTHKQLFSLLSLGPEFEFCRFTVETETQRNQLLCKKVDVLMNRLVWLLENAL